MKMRKAQGERTAGLFWLASWLSPPNPDDGTREDYTRVFDVRREALEFAHRKRAQKKVDVLVTRFSLTGLEFPHTAVQTGSRLYRPGQAPEEAGDV